MVPDLESLRARRWFRWAVFSGVYLVVLGTIDWLLIELKVPRELGDLLQELAVQDKREHPTFSATVALEEELLVDGPFDASPIELVHRGESQATVSVRAQSARLSPDALDFLHGRDMAPPTEAARFALTREFDERSEGACRTSLLVTIAPRPGHPPAQPERIRLSQGSRGSPRTRQLEIAADRTETSLVVEVHPQYGESAEGPACKREVTLGDDFSEEIRAPFRLDLISAAGTGFRFTFQQLAEDFSEEGYAPFLLGSDSFVPAGRIAVRSDRDSRVMEASGDGAPTIKLRKLEVDAEKLRVALSGEGKISGRGVESLTVLEWMEQNRLISSLLGLAHAGPLLIGLFRKAIFSKT